MKFILETTPYKIDGSESADIQSRLFVYRLWKHLFIPLEMLRILEGVGNIGKATLAPAFSSTSSLYFRDPSKHFLHSFAQKQRNMNYSIQKQSKEIGVNFSSAAVSSLSSFPSYYRTKIATKYFSGRLYPEFATEIATQKRKKLVKLIQQDPMMMTIGVGRRNENICGFYACCAIAQLGATDTSDAGMSTGLENLEEKLDYYLQISNLSASPTEFIQPMPMEEFFIPGVRFTEEEEEEEYDEDEREEGDEED